MQKDGDGEPEPPHHHLFHRLNVQDAEHEDELVEDEVPELVFQVLQTKKTNFYPVSLICIIMFCM